MSLKKRNPEPVVNGPPLGSGGQNTPLASGSVTERVSAAFKSARLKKGWSLEILRLEIINRSMGEIKNISTAHLSRIENGLARPTDVQLYWINKALAQPLGPILDSAGATEQGGPFYIMRSQKVQARLHEVSDGRRPTDRLDHAHKKFIDQGIYRWVPLEPDPEIVAPNDQCMATDLVPHNRISLLQVKHAKVEFMREHDTLDSHEGQEGLYCLQGEMEFWCVPAEGPPVQHRLERGDFVRLDARQRHGFRALGAEPAQALHIYSNLTPEVKKIVDISSPKKKSRAV